MHCSWYQYYNIKYNKKVDHYNYFLKCYFSVASQIRTNKEKYVQII